MSGRRWDLLQGWAVWGLAALLVLALPGHLWKPALPPAFPWEALLPMLLVMSVLAFSSLLLAGLGGPCWARSRWLALLDAPPEMVWGGLLLALWPAAWGPPGHLAWGLAFLVVLLPGELRWLCQALPGESPFPEAWGTRAVRLARYWTLRRLAPRWVAVRAPLWITATLVLERLLGLPGLGGDWLARMALRDKAGLLIWLLAYAVLWSLAQRGEAKA